MDKSDPTLVPEWLRCSGTANGNGNGNSSHHFPLSPLISDVPSTTNSIPKKSFKSTSDHHDIPRLECSSSSNFRRCSNANGNIKHPYSSFSRGCRDKEKEKDKSFHMDRWDSDCSESLSSILGSRVQKDGLRRSYSMVSGNVLPQRITLDSKYSENSLLKINNSLTLGGSVHGIKKTEFDKNFPSLGNEERQVVNNVAKISSHPNTSVLSLPVSNSPLIQGEGWTSVLAELPSIIVPLNSVSSSTQDTHIFNSVSELSSTISCLNMAETLVQSPRTQDAPQLSYHAQRLEELAVKQSKQLIPMTPSLKTSALTSLKGKSRPASRTSEAVKSVPMHTSSPSLRSAPVRSDTSKTSSVGKFIVLKPCWENVASSITPKDVSTPKDAFTPTSNGSVKIVNNDQKPSSSQSQSRKDFFNLVRKNSSANHSQTLTDSGLENLLPNKEQSDEKIKVANGIVSHHNTDNDGDGNSRINTSHLDEEEINFLHYLGWKETDNDDDGEGLTEEEINAFLEYIKQRPAAKSCLNIQPKLSSNTEARA